MTSSVGRQVNTQLRLEGRLKSEADLPDLEYGRHSVDVGRTWWIGWVWHIWTGNGWQKAIAAKAGPQ